MVSYPWQKQAPAAPAPKPAAVLALVGAMAAEAGAQVWLEMVGDPTGTAIVIEDGMVQEEAK